VKALSSIFVLAVLGLSMSPAPSFAQRVAKDCLIACNNSYNPAEAAGPLKCADRLGHYPALHAADIRSIINRSKVKIVPICEYRSLAENDPHALLGKGNVDGLKLRIAANRAIAGKLADGGYRADDVVAIVFGDNNAVTVYVHKRRA
jgi:hypothetical protein